MVSESEDCEGYSEFPLDKVRDFARHGSFKGKLTAVICDPKRSLNCAQLTSLRLTSKPLSTSESSRDLTSRGNRRPSRAGTIRCLKGDSYRDASDVEEMDGGKEKR